MRFVMVRKDVAPLVSVVQPTIHLARQVQLLLEPQRQRLPERTVARRGIGEVRFQQPFEFRQRLVVEADVIELVGTQPGFGQAVVDGV